MKSTVFRVSRVAVLVVLVLSGGLFASPAFAGGGSDLTPDIEVSDGGTLELNTGTFGGVVTSTTQTSASTAAVKVNQDQTAELTGTYSGFYGTASVLSGATLNLNTDVTDFKAGFTLGGDGFTATSKLIVTKPVSVVNGSGDHSSISLHKYGQLDVSANVTLSGNVNFLAVPADATSPVVKFFIQETTPKITALGFKETDAGNDFSVARNFLFDMTSAPAGTVGEKTFVVATVDNQNALPVTVGTPAVTGNTGGLWSGFACDFEDNAGKYNLVLKASFNPAFSYDSGTKYVGTVAKVAKDVVGTALLLRDIVSDENVTFTENGSIDLNSKSITGTGIVTIADSKILTFTRTGVETFQNKINFASALSSLRLIGTNVFQIFGADGGIDATSSGAGTVVLGDGTAATTATLDATAVTKAANKVGKIVVNSNAVLILGAGVQ